MPSVIGIDLGTSAVKALLLDADARVRGVTRATYDVATPRPGRAETRPRAWAAATGSAVRRLLRETGAVRVDGIGLAGQMHGVVMVDARLRPLGPAVLWPDQRAIGELDAYRALPAEDRSRLGNPIVEGMAGPTLRWFRARPEVMERAAWALQPKDWLRAWLTSTPGTEPSDASATLLWDLPGDGWFTGLAARLGIPASLLPAVEPSAAVAGTLHPGAAQALALAPGTPVVHGAADTAAAAVGTALPTGAVQLTMGTGAQFVTLTDALTTDPEPVTHTYRAATPQGWYAMAAVKNVGLALEWARGLFGLEWRRFNDEAFSVPAGAEGVRFAPYLSGERTPLLDPDARGAWRGLTGAHRRAHLLRAVVDGVALAIADAHRALVDRGHDPAQLRVSGGGVGDTRWQQLLADVLERPLLAVTEQDASALGAAHLAGIGLGWWGWPEPAADHDLARLADPSDGAAALRRAPADDAEPLYPGALVHRARRSGPVNDR